MITANEVRAARSPFLKEIHTMKHWQLILAFIVTALPAFPVRGYEVWLTDQNNTLGYSSQNPRGTHGGRIVIWDGKDLDFPGTPIMDRPAILDLGLIFAAGGPNNQTGAEVARPHMLAVSQDQKYMALAFVASGHVAIIEAATRRPKALFRMSAGAGGARQAHSAQWTMDGTAILVANQNGKLFERIRYDKATDTFTHDTAATLNLATCRTPNGFPCETPTTVNESDPNYFGLHNCPDNAPICPLVTFNNKAIITLRGGGILVADPTTTPMSIVAEYGNRFYGRDGCGVTERNISGKRFRGESHEQACGVWSGDGDRGPGRVIAGVRAGNGGPRGRVG